jgi:hypothetical protein
MRRGRLGVPCARPDGKRQQTPKNLLKPGGHSG